MSDTRRQTWLLYSDISTRFNILIEECAHLQDTIFGLLRSKGAIDLLRACQDSREERARIFDKASKRSVYDSLSTREKAFANLWNTLGSLILGLTANQATVREHFERIIGESAANSGTTSSFYWFASLRGQFLEKGFAFYTDQIEHAHEKLIQMLENAPGTLPHPILLRRWNSATYGEFLSNYSRHLNWQTQQYLGRLASPTGSVSSMPDPQSSEGSIARGVEAFRERRSLTHCWAHFPTSRMRMHRYQDKYFASIRSAYFYLEQPVLFPLLYHECAHLSFSGPGDLEECEVFRLRAEAAQTLRRQATFEIPDIEYWDHFTEEVWADAISVVLGGRPYLAALFLQLFGQSGAEAFQMYEYDNDLMIPIEKIGTLATRCFEVPYPSHEESHFWEARLRLALWVAQEARACKRREEIDWLASVEASIELWFRSGSVVFDRAVSSHEHETYWSYRRRLNDWVFSVCQRCLAPVVKRMKILQTPDRAFNLSSRDLLGHISDAVETFKMMRRFHGQEFEFRGPPCERSGGNDRRATVRLEDIAVQVRWHLAEHIVSRIDSARSPSEVRDWTEYYANYMRNDGSAAFRLALEWSLARSSLYDEAADLVKQDCPVPFDPSQFSKLLFNAVQKDLKDEGIDTEEARNELSNWLRNRAYDNSPEIEQTRRGRSFKIRAIRETIHTILETIEGFFYQVPEREISIGTLSLGVFNPAGIEVRGNLHACHEAAAKRFSEGVVAQRKLVERVSARSPFRASLVPLVGDYNFLHWIEGSTPVERDPHPQYEIPMIVKPRLVLCVFGRDNMPFIDDQKEWAFPFGTVSLVQFRHRWRWIQIASLLKKEQRWKDKAALFLSSAWEDSVLITWHDKEDELWAAFKDLGVDLQPYEVDSQSAIALMSLFAPGKEATRASTMPLPTNPQDNCERRFETYLASLLVDGTAAACHVNERTGRYDYTIVWGDGECEECTLDRFGRILVTLDAHFWSMVGAMSTSYENVRIFRGRESQKSYRIVSHVLLRSNGVVRPN